jgi:hypothetical protein
MITLLILIAVVIAYFAFVLIYGSITDYQPPFKQKLEVVNDSVHIPVYDDEFTFLSWNIGYGGLGYKEDFFYDGGKKTRLQKKILKSILMESMPIYPIKQRLILFFFKR